MKVLDRIILDFKKIGPRGTAYVLFRLMADDPKFWRKPVRKIMSEFDVDFSVKTMLEYVMMRPNEKELEN